MSIENKNLNWIIIKCNNTPVTSRVALKVTKSTIQVKGSLIIGRIAISSNDALFHSGNVYDKNDNSNIIFSDFIINQDGYLQGPFFSGSGSFTFNNGTVTLDHPSNAGLNNLYMTRAIFNNVVITTTAGIYLYDADIKGCTFTIKVTGTNVPLDFRADVNLVDTDINLNNGTSANNRIYITEKTVSMDNCNINGGNTGKVLSVDRGAQVQIKNSRVKASSGVTTLYVNGGSNVILTAGSSFTDNNNITNTSNQADGAGSYIRKDNTVGGSFSAINGGGIINI